MSTRREAVDDAVSGIQRSTTELKAVCAELDETLSCVIAEYTPATCRSEAEFVRDMAARAGIALARIQQCCGMLRALSYDASEAPHG